MDIKLDVCMHNNGKDTKHSRHIAWINHLLRYISNNNNLGLVYDTKIEDAPPYDLLRQSILITEKLLYLFSDSRWQYCQDTSINTAAYIVFYQGGPIDRFTHILGQFSESSA